MPRTWPRAVLLVVALAPAAPGVARGGTTAEPPPAPVPRRHTSALAALPDLLQSDPQFGFAREGAFHCAPVAVANALLRLSGAGWPRLAPRTGDPRLAAVDVVRTLAGPRCMNTSIAEGTSTSGVLLGIERYVRDRGYEIARLEHAGWRKRPAGYAAASALPDPQAVEAFLAEHGTAAFVNVGWYARSPDGTTWRRHGGHWLTLGGYGVDEEGRPASRWILRDPSPRAGCEPRAEFVALERVPTGRLEGPEPELPREAAGLHRLVGGPLPPREGLEPLLDGVVLLALAPAGRAAPAAPGAR